MFTIVQTFQTLRLESAAVRSPQAAGAQAAIVFRLTATSWTAVGDPRQRIYGFARGDTGDA